jgi:hypothetical protein
MNHKLFLISDLEAAKACLLPPGTTFQVGGETVTVVGNQIGPPAGRGIQEYRLMVRDSETRHWAIPYAAWHVDKPGAYDPFATDAANPEYVSAGEVHPRAVQSIVWEPLP